MSNWHIGSWKSALIALAVVILATQGGVGNEPFVPKLVVVVSVDQGAGEYYDRFAENFADQGFARRAQRTGAWFSDCRHRHAITVTAPGHAVLLTGCYPDRHGVTENDMYDRATGKSVYCVADPTAKVIGDDREDPVSPRRLLADTLGDRIKLATEGRGKVFGLAIKDRASILMCGRMADAAFWMSDAGLWVTSDFYRPDLPGYLRTLNDGNYLKQFAGKTWSPSLPPEKWRHGSPERNDFERPYADMTPGFPHVLPAVDDKQFIKHLACGPYGNEAVFLAAGQLIAAEKLGADDAPDLLCINLSSNDYVGHSFGPHSLEAEDMAYRTDEQLARFVDETTKTVNHRPWLLVVSADHGVAPIPEWSAAKKLLGARGPISDGLKERVERAARAALELPADAPPVVKHVTSYEVFLASDHPALVGERQEIAERAIQRALVALPEVGVAITRGQVLQGLLANTLQQQLARSFHPARSGDVLFCLAPYAVPGGSAAATHGAPWTYDTHVPLVFFASGDGANTQAIGRGWFDRQVSPAQIAPTVAKLLRIDPPAMCEEPPLLELLAPADVKRP